MFLQMSPANNLDLNSRNITFNDKNLSLTERESDLIIFIHEEKNVSIKDLQKKVTIFFHLHCLGEKTCYGEDVKVNSKIIKGL